MTDWQRFDLRHVARIVGGSTPTPSPEYWDGGVPFFTPPDLRPVHGGVVTETGRTLTDLGVATGSTAVRAGSVILSKRAPIGYVARLGIDGAFNQGCLVVEPNPEKVEARFLTWLLSVRSEELNVLGRGTTFVELSASDLASLEVFLPGVPTQRAIADYLDRETARIDTLLAEQQRLIEMLRERRRAVMARAVTLGVDDGAALRASGDPTIGPMPSHWTVRSLRHWLTSLDGQRIPLSAEERGHMQGVHDYYGASGVIDHVDRFLFDEPLVLVSEDGANLLARSSPIAFAAKGRYWVNNHAHVLRPNAGDVDFWAARLEALDVSPYVTGSAQPKLTASALMNIRVSAPTDITEQRRIADYLDEQTAKIDALIAETERFIELSRERRSALITAAVTGQIDVRTEGAA